MSRYGPPTRDPFHLVRMLRLSCGDVSWLIPRGLHVAVNNRQSLVRDQYHDLDDALKQSPGSVHIYVDGRIKHDPPYGIIVDTP